MSGHENALQLEFCSSILEISPVDWNRLAHPYPSPFMEWEWLAMLEASGSIAPPYGWQPYHAVLRRNGRIVALAPLYLKSHSMGEFVFDFAWADLAAQMGIEYYPKLVGMSPATPSVCFQPLVDPAEDTAAVNSALVAGIETLVERHRLGGVALNYVEPEFAGYLLQHGYLRWKHQSFLWTNPGLSSFAEYLCMFRKNQRRNIRRERDSIAQQGLHVRVLQGEELSEELLKCMYRYYRSTNDQFGPWAARFLTREFFPLAARQKFIGFLHRRVVLVAAYDATHSRDDAQPLAMSFLVRKGPLLFGRYWGALRFYENLHFELCYYRPIEWAIEQGIRSFDPGIGSAHKIRRGFEAVANYSMHRFRDPRMNTLMGMHIDQVNTAEQEQIDGLNALIPFVTGAGGGKRDGQTG